MPFHTRNATLIAPFPPAHAILSPHPLLSTPHLQLAPSNGHFATRSPTYPPPLPLSPHHVLCLQGLARIQEHVQLKPATLNSKPCMPLPCPPPPPLTPHIHTFDLSQPWMADAPALCLHTPLHIHSLKPPPHSFCMLFVGSGPHSGAGAAEASHPQQQAAPTFETRCAQGHTKDGQGWCVVLLGQHGCVLEGADEAVGIQRGQSGFGQPHITSYL